MKDEQDNDLCEECGSWTLKLIGTIKNTKVFVCINCYSEKSVFMGHDDCEHEYTARDECMHCGDKQ